MKASDRAKIFAPFSPLKSLSDALREKEIVRVSKAELADERIEELDAILHKVSLGDEITIIHYNNGIYEKTAGLISEIDVIAKSISIAKRTIMFENIYDIKM